MTRYARSGNTQKHQKVPGEATPWRQWNKPARFVHQKETELEIKKLRNKKRKLRYKSKQKALREGNISKDGTPKEGTKSPIVTSEEKNHTPSVTQQIELPDKTSPTSPESKTIPETSLNKGDSEEKTPDGGPPERKKPSFLERLRMNRSDSRIVLLPPKMERKIYNIKKAMRKKDLPQEYIREVVRKERRYNEMKFRKMNQPCLNCRQPGHVYANCPQSSQHGICFKCGSTEHTSSVCSKRITGYPFAKCFICKEDGHISRDCPKNDHGVYPKGGKCYLCGNVNHLRKDCPTVKTEKDEEIIAAHTIKEGVSVDLEVIPDAPQEPQPPKKPKRVKVVKF